MAISEGGGGGGCKCRFWFECEAGVGVGVSSLKVLWKQIMLSEVLKVIQFYLKNLP